jgi:hypothetical protein
MLLPPPPTTPTRSAREAVQLLIARSARSAHRKANSVPTPSHEGSPAVGHTSAGSKQAVGPRQHDTLGSCLNAPCCAGSAWTWKAHV